MAMIIAVHVICALGGIGVTTLAALFPSTRRLRLGTLLVVLTLVSGTYLVFTRHAPLLHTCISGLIYLTVTATCMAIGRYRLAAASVRVP